MISRIVSATDNIPQQGLLFDPLIVNDFLQQDDAARHEAEQAVMEVKTVMEMTVAMVTETKMSGKDGSMKYMVSLWGAPRAAW